MKNWKTTLFGLMGAVWIAVQPLIATGRFDLSKEWRNLVGAAIVAAFSFVAKDFNVSGSPAQTIEAVASAK